MEENKNNTFDTNESDDFVIGKGFVFEEATDTKKENKKDKKKRKSVIKNTIWIVSIFAVAIALSVFCVYALFDFLGLGFGRGENCQINIKQGASVSEIADELYDVGAVKMPALFKLYSRIKGYDSQYKYGLYTFNTESGYDTIADMLINEGAKAESVKVTIPEGTGINDYIKNVNGEDVTVKGIATILEEKGVCSADDFIYALNEVKLEGRLLKSCNYGKTYYTLEGYLFPDTYEFYAYDSEECARMVVEKMIKNTEAKITDDMYKRAEEMGYSINDILTMASIIQMEAGNRTDEMPNVAAVFYNRLNDEETGGTLGSSPTLFYGDSFKNDDGRYNTQADAEFKAIKGLPPGPLCSPGIAAINAALYPANDSEYLYFVTDSSGNFYYHKTLAEQNKTINKLKGQNNWTYENY